MLILQTLALEPMHGWAVAQRIQQISEELLEVQQGSLYPALYRLEHQGLITSEWGESENRRKAKYYRLTPAGRRHLAAEVSRWSRYTEAVSLVLEATGRAP